ncbi:sulfatase [Fusarium acutatum]|uniref:Sulfatase n=1 Tax=Fusarium acutatum TaxID=78861 RepID=A0A8H4NUL8_9HYPO|nr:sulfatase [Fusarium acutatum]
MFFTDHGEYLRDLGLIEKWTSGLSDCLVKEPLIVGGGPIPEGVVINDMTEMVDLLPTVFGLCGVPELYPYNGKSLMPLINLVSGYKHKEFAFLEGGFLPRGKTLQHEKIQIVGKATACRDLEWTYVHRLYEMGELFDRKNDPKEGKQKADEPQRSVLHVSMSEHWWQEIS